MTTFKTNKVSGYFVPITEDARELYIPITGDQLWYKAKGHNIVTIPFQHSITLLTTDHRSISESEAVKVVDEWKHDVEGLGTVYEDYDETERYCNTATQSFATLAASLNITGRCAVVIEKEVGDE